MPKDGSDGGCTSSTNFWEAWTQFVYKIPIVMTLEGPNLCSCERKESDEQRHGKFSSSRKRPLMRRVRSKPTVCYVRISTKSGSVKEDQRQWMSIQHGKEALHRTLNLDEKLRPFKDHGSDLPKSDLRREKVQHSRYRVRVRTLRAKGHSEPDQISEGGKLHPFISKRRMRLIHADRFPR